MVAEQFTDRDYPTHIDIIMSCKHNLNTLRSNLIRGELDGSDTQHSTPLWEGLGNDSNLRLYCLSYKRWMFP